MVYAKLPEAEYQCRSCLGPIPVERRSPTTIYCCEACRIAVAKARFAAREKWALADLATVPDTFQGPHTVTMSSEFAGIRDFIRSAR